MMTPAMCCPYSFFHLIYAFNFFFIRLSEEEEEEEEFELEKEYLDLLQRVFTKEAGAAVNRWQKRPPKKPMTSLAVANDTCRNRCVVVVVARCCKSLVAHGVLSRPLPGIFDGSRFVNFPQLSHVVGQRIIGIRC